MNLPKGIFDIDPLPSMKCKKCQQVKRRDSFMFRIKFDPDIINESMAELLPQMNNTAGTFCIF